MFLSRATPILGVTNILISDSGLYISLTHRHSLDRWSPSKYLVYSLFNIFQYSLTYYLRVEVGKHKTLSFMIYFWETSYLSPNILLDISFT